MHELLEQSTPRARTKLGEELPVFCEKCGYSLHGLPQDRCEHCGILQFKCPECGHHQPINTLRPAFQNMLGRMRATWLAMWVAFRGIVFLLLLFAWAAMGANWAYTWYSDNGMHQEHRRVSTEMMMGFGIFGAAYGLFWRMMLLRWRRGLLVGAALGAIVFAAVCTGTWMEWTSNRDERRTAEIFGEGLLFAAGFGSVCVVLAAGVAWLIWTGLVRAFLPSRVGTALLEWQTNLSQRASSQLATDGSLASSQTSLHHGRHGDRRRDSASP